MESILGFQVQGRISSTGATIPARKARVWELREEPSEKYPLLRRTVAKAYER